MSLFPDPEPSPAAPEPMPSVWLVCTRLRDWNIELGRAIGNDPVYLACTICDVPLAVNKPRHDEIKAGKWTPVCAGCAKGEQR